MNVQKKPNKIAHAKKKRFSLDLFLVSLSIFLAFFAILSFVVGGALWLTLNIGNGNDSVLCTFEYVENGESKKLFERRLDSKDRSGEYYVSLSDIAELTNMRYVSDHDGTILALRDNGEYIRFKENSSDCEINGIKCSMNAPIVKKSGVLYVPIGIFEEHLNCFTVSKKKQGEISASFDKDAASKGFALQTSISVEMIEKPENLINIDGKSTTVYDFIADLSEYEKYMNPDDSREYLILVNPSSPLDSTYVPAQLTDLADTRKDNRATQKMRLYAAKSLEAFLIEARANGINDVTVTSGYRSYAYQNTLFKQYTQNELNKNSSLTKEEAEAIVMTYSCRPGTSEHQSGLCIDMHNQPSATRAFANTASAKWLAENCYKFGFVLRFPLGKEEITKIIYEPWHFRYVGRYHAEKMYELGLCLEEYVLLLD